MSTKKLTVVLAGLVVVLPFVVSAGGEREKGIFAILDEIVARLDRLESLQVPDLVPVPITGVLPGRPISSDPAGFCRFDAQGTFRVFVYNQDAGIADPSHTQVFFRVPIGAEGQNSCGDGCAQVNVATPELAPFRGGEVTVPIPEGCFGSAFGPDDINNCQFKIAVDGTNLLNESNELNNGAFGACQGLL